jgi:tetratricopeptide (TPR) repeat protein
MIAGNLLMAQPGTTTEKEVNEQKVFIEANKQKLLENYEEASVLFKEVLKNDPRNHAAAYELARVYDVLDNDEKALSSIKIAVSLNPTNTWYKLFLADVLDKSNNYREVISLFKELSEKQPENEYFYFQTAYYQVKDDKIDDAIDTYSQIEKNFGQSVEVTRKKHTLYLGKGDTKNAAKELESLVKKFPDNVSYLHLLAAFYQQQEQTADAKKVYNRILQLDPTNAEATIALASDKKDKGDDSNYLRSLKAVFNEKNENIDIKIKTLYPYITKISEGNADPEMISSAVELGEILTEVHPNDAKAFSIYGDMLFHAGRDNEAIEQYKKTIAINKNVFSVWEQMMYIYAEQYEMEKLAALSEEAMDIYPNQVKLFYFNGIANGELENYKDAISALNQAVIMAGKKTALKADILVRMVKPLIATGKTEKAQDKANAAMELEPNNYRVISANAYIAVQKKDYDAAEKLYQSAFSNGGQSNPEVLEDYGDFMLAQGKEALANEYWIKAQAAGGKSTRLQNKITNKGL